MAETGLRITPISVPADSSSMFPYLRFGPEGELFLNWLHEPDTVSNLLMARLDKDQQWSRPLKIADGTDWFVNWADFPSLAVGTDGHLVTYALPKSSDDTYAYDVGLFQSVDNGRSWEGPIVPHRDGVLAEHGFVSFLPMSEDKIGAVWLDGRNYGLQATGGHEGHGSGGEPDMTLRFATIDRQGQISDDYELDPKVCSCCQTDAAIMEDGAIVVYRDRSAEEIRDISYVRLIDGSWTKPKSIGEDLWKINGCPVNGPAVAASGKNVAVSWFTMAGGEAKVQLVFSNDSGAEFGESIRLDEGDPIGRIDAQFWDNEHVLVSWIEKESEASAAIRLKLISTKGEVILHERIADINPARSSGFPRMAVAARVGYLAWTETGDKPAIKMVQIRQ